MNEELKTLAVEAGAPEEVELCTKYNTKHTKSGPNRE